MKAQKTWWMDTLGLTLAIGLLFLFCLGCRALSVPDESRYTEIPREMLFFHDFITPHLDGVKYFEKPPLLYWIQAGVIHLFGLKEFFLRLPTALFALCGCVATYLAGRIYFDRRAGLFAAGILATSPLYFAMAHSITLDMTLTLWQSLGLFSFLIAVDLPRENKARRYVAWLMFVCAALAVLTKGLVGVILPGFVIFCWLCLFKRWQEVRFLYLPSGLFIFLLLALPWHILVQLKNPEFAHFYFIDQQFVRYLTKASGRFKPFWWFIPILVAGFFPWILFLSQSFHKGLSNWREKPKEVFLWLWAVIFFVFFSLSDSKLIPYILPVLPPLALLVGRYFASAGDSPWGMRGIALLSFIFALICVSAPFWHHAFLPEAIFYLRWIGLVFLLMSLGVLFLPSFFSKIAWIFGAQAIFLLLLNIAAPAFDLRPIKPLALEIKSLAKPDDIIASYGLYYQDLPVYTERLVLIVDWKNELTFGYQHQASAKNTMIDAGQFWQLWAGPKRIFALMDEDDYARNRAMHKIYVLARKHDNLLVSNDP